MTRNNTLLLTTIGLLAFILGAIKLVQSHQIGSSQESIVLYEVLPHPYFTGVRAGGTAFAKQSGVSVRSVVGQESTQANVNTNIESMFTLGYKAFAIYPVDPAGSKGLFARLHNGGCFVVAYGAQPEKGTDTPFAVATDTQSAATTATEKLIELMGHKGRILNVLESLTDANTPIRKAAIEAVVAKYPDVQIIQTVGDVTNEQAAREKIESALVARGNEVDGVICTGYTTTVAAATLLAEYNSKPGAKFIHCVGLDTDDRVLAAIRNGTMDATLAQNPFGHGYISCSLLDLLLKGWQPKKDYQFIDSGCLVVTKANADTFQKDIEAMTEKIVTGMKDTYFNPPAAKAPDPMLELSDITKNFSAVRALDGVSLAFRAGEIHGLVGENGAGKSTAIKIMTGIHQPDSGEIRFNFQPVSLRSHRDALARGIGIVNQELYVIPDASVAENIMIDKLITRGCGVVDWQATYREAEKHMALVGLAVPPEQLVSGLSAAQKQLIQIAKALSSDVKVLLLDEPTSSLTEHEARRLFSLLRELRAKGVALIFVSHKLDEVFALCDSITVLRDGKLVGTRETAKTSPKEIVAMMIGRESNDDHLGQLAPDWNTVVLQAENIVRKDKAEDVSFTLHRGEILGFYGLVGSGRTELARILIGEDPMDSGRITIRGKAARVHSVGQSLYQYGLGYVTENRKEEGLFLDDSVETNLTVGIWPRIRNRLTRGIDFAAEVVIARRQVDAMTIKATGLSQRVGNLSGGNQQKVSIGKWLAADCDILIIDEPTVGVDVGAKQQIHQLIWNLAAREGKTIILISSDLPELVRIANRMLVFRARRIVGEVRDIDTKKKTYAEVSAEIAPHFE